MPVLDNPALPNNSKLGNEPYLCQQRKRKEGYFVQVRRYFPDGSYSMGPEFIPDRLSISCRYDMSLHDSGCMGCRWKGQGEAYAESVLKGQQ